MTASGNRRARQALADAWDDNRAAWDDYVAGMAADWSSFTDHEHAAAVGVFDREVAAFNEAVVGKRKGGGRERR